MAARYRDNPAGARAVRRLGMSSGRRWSDRNKSAEDQAFAWGETNSLGRG